VSRASSPLALRVMGFLGILAISCAWPTEMCGCPPARSRVYLIGRVVDGHNVPMSGVRVHAFAAHKPDPLSHDYVYGIGIRTDTLGEFREMLYSTFSPGTHWLHVTVISNDLADTITVHGGEAVLRYEGDVPNTVLMTFQVPWVDSNVRR
jgi:hypothetical protein